MLSPWLKECLRSLAWNSAENPEKYKTGKGERVRGKTENTMDHERTERSPLPLTLYPRFRFFPVDFFLVRLFKIRNHNSQLGHASI